MVVVEIFKVFLGGRGISMLEDKMVRKPGDLDYDEYETLPSSSVSTHMTAGAIAGIMEHCVMYPLDSVKVIVLYAKMV